MHQIAEEVCCALEIQRRKRGARDDDNAFQALRSLVEGRRK